MAEITIRKRALAADEIAGSQRKFFKKTARGKVVKVLRERYLRTDIPCGSRACASCIDGAKTALTADGMKRNKVVEGRHYIVPDTNAFLHQVRCVAAV